MSRSTILAASLLLSFVACSPHASCQMKEDSWNEYTDADDGGLFANIFVGGGTGTLAGGSAGMYAIRGFQHPWFGGGGFAEFAQLRPSRSGSTDGLFSVDYQETLKIRKPPSIPHRGIFPFTTFGYSHLFGSGNGINYGGGVILHYTKRTELVPALRIEYRCYDLPGQAHNQIFRISWQGEFNTP